ncbi:iron-siderophore ABC transporter substrate-binding protein [Compostimonas suwonensis]|uniref:Iron complex transport system substrate-binding protein n=1 Tax=Compostimonas suwonensis TaxID=1048394 RepID=A0A2M9BUJ7_9MICO|nr:iron-siderophore ABC transporter substrate-binding protein [Compostimonas suwonensis]PJJ61624.1 iron complex transport system substrate-binding protein [Compostimonas suwonensis]
MTRLTRSRSIALAALLATGLGLGGLTACSADPSGSSDPAETPGSADPAASGAFPVTVESSLGDAVIEAAPQRVVTIGWGSADTAIALGVTPVGMEEAVWGGDGDGYFPWVREAIEENGAELPQTFTVSPEVDVEAVLELEPDLILAPQSGISQDDFDTLSAIAPTVAYPGEPWRTAWDEQIAIIGQALGKGEEAAGLVDEIDAQLAEAAAQNPEFAGLSFAYVYTAEPGSLSLYQQGDPRVDLISALGLVEDPAVAAVPITAGTFASTVGLERADLLDDVDVLFAWYNDQANADQIAAQPLFAQVPAVVRGSYIPVVDNQLAMASSLLTPLSVPWALDSYVPLIADAAERVQ